MKKWRRFFQLLFTRHILSPDRVAADVSTAEPATDLEMIRFSVWRSLRGAKKHERFLFDYTAEYAPIMDELRMEGWAVDLYVGPGGELSYVISSDRSGMLA